MKPGDRVQTPDGPGTVVDNEGTMTIRYGVLLDNWFNKNTYPKRYYWPHEIEKIKK
jgi:hypothetical protein